jgi:uncharacterized protein YecA (UPF0149 family)
VPRPNQAVQRAKSLMEQAGVQMKGAEKGGEQKPDGEKKVGRNDACPCGSGKKYKKCCGA